LDRILSFLAGSRGSGSVAVDSTTIEAKGGEMIGYDGLSIGRVLMVHVAVDEGSRPIALTLSPKTRMILRPSRNYTIGLILSPGGCLIVLVLLMVLLRFMGFMLVLVLRVGGGLMLGGGV